MSEENCVLCKIARGEIKAEKGFIRETGSLVVINDKFPKAPIHILIVPKKHVPSLKLWADVDGELMKEMLQAARETAAELGIEDYKLVFNNGKYTEIPGHLHLHLAAGEDLRAAAI